MPKVLILTETSQETADSLVMESMISALKRTLPATTQILVKAVDSLQISGSIDLELLDSEFQDEQVIFCSLTLSLPDTLLFPAQAIYQACRDVPGLRRLLMEQFDIPSADGCFWLPVVLTAKGPLYGEVIASQSKLSEELPLDIGSFYQPRHFPDAIRQKLYHLGHCLMQLLAAPPATYLVQFAVQESIIYFDRLWPFPASPAIASLGVQEPDLFACHWYCLSGQSVLDLTIVPTLANQAST